MRQPAAEGYKAFDASDINAALPLAEDLPKANAILQKVGSIDARRQVTDVNQAVLSEVMFESLPQLVAITGNEIQLNGIANFTANINYQITAIFSLLLITHAVFGTTYYAMIGGWDWRSAIEVPQTPLDDEQEQMFDQARRWLQVQPLCGCWRAILSCIDDDNDDDKLAKGRYSHSSGKDLLTIAGGAADLGESALEAGMVGAAVAGVASANALSA